MWQYFMTVCVFLNFPVWEKADILTFFQNDQPNSIFFLTSYLPPYTHLLLSIQPPLSHSYHSKLAAC